MQNLKILHLLKKYSLPDLLEECRLNLSAELLLALLYELLANISFRLGLKFELAILITFVFGLLAPFVILIDLRALFSLFKIRLLRSELLYIFEEGFLIF